MLDLEIFEKDIKNSNNSLTTKYPNKAVFTIRSQYGLFSDFLVKKLSINEKSRLIFSKNKSSNDFYFAVLPEMSDLKGYKLQKRNYKEREYYLFYDKTINTKKGVEKGIYELDLEPIFDSKNGIDWYLIEKIDN